MKKQKVVTLPRGFGKHLIGLTDNGPYRHLIQLTGTDINVARWCDLFQAYMVASLPTKQPYHILWWCANDGSIYVAIAGNTHINKMVQQYVTHSINKEIVEHAHIIYSGRSLRDFVNVHLASALERFTKTKGKGKSFSGSLPKQPA